MFQNSIDNISMKMNSGNDIYTRLSAGQILLKPSDDPTGAARAIMYQSEISSLSQYDTARIFAYDALAQEDQALSSISNILTTGLTEKIIAAGNGAFSNEDRKALATELEGIRDQLLDLANTQSSNGRFIFSGYKTGTQPFLENGSYVGGSTAKTQTVAQGVDIQTGHTGNNVFLSGTGDDLFATLDKVINALNQPVETDEDRAVLQATLDEAIVSLNKVIDNIGLVQAEVGTALQQLESLNYRSDTQQIEVVRRLQQTVGSDPSAMIALISQTKMVEFSLSSSMMAFQSMQQLSLFNIMG
jgi:flagellar hook-associated protein 3 FlgL